MQGIWEKIMVLSDESGRAAGWAGFRGSDVELRLQDVAAGKYEVKAFAGDDWHRLGAMEAGEGEPRGRWRLDSRLESLSGLSVVGEANGFVAAAGAGRSLLFAPAIAEAAVAAEPVANMAAAEDSVPVMAPADEYEAEARPVMAPAEVYEPDSQPVMSWMGDYEAEAQPVIAPANDYASETQPVMSWTGDYETEAQPVMAPAEYYGAEAQPAMSWAGDYEAEAQPVMSWAEESAPEAQPVMSWAEESEPEAQPVMNWMEDPREPAAAWAVDSTPAPVDPMWAETASGNYDIEPEVAMELEANAQAQTEALFGAAAGAAQDDSALYGNFAETMAISGESAQHILASAFEPIEDLEAQQTPKTPQAFATFIDSGDKGVVDMAYGDGSGKSGMLGQGRWARVEQPGLPGWHYLTGDVNVDGSPMRALALIAECDEMPAHLVGWAHREDGYYIVLMDPTTGEVLRAPQA